MYCCLCLLLFTKQSLIDVRLNVKGVTEMLKLPTQIFEEKNQKKKKKKQLWYCDKSETIVLREKNRSCDDVAKETSAAAAAAAAATCFFWALIKEMQKERRTLAIQQLKYNR